jgi:hypothetical protein
MRLAVQDLLVGAETADSDTLATQHIAEKLPVGAEEFWSLRFVGYQPLCLSDSLGVMRCSHLELAQASVQAEERLRVLGWRDV